MNGTWITKEIEYEDRRGRTYTGKVKVYQRDSGRSDEIVVRTRYGNESHLAYMGSSVTHCVVWMKVNATTRATGETAVTCEK